MSVIGRYLVVMLLLSFGTEYCQSINERSITGVWQISSSEITAGLFDNYRFFDNKKFEFRPSDYQGLKRIASLTGHYSVKTDSLILTVESITEIVGGTIAREPTSGGSGWEISESKLKTTKLKPLRFALSIKLCEDNRAKRCLLIDSLPFYEIRL